MRLYFFNSAVIANSKMGDCELKTRLSDIVSHLRNNYREILTQQLKKRFSTMPFYNVFKTIVTF